MDTRIVDHDVEAAERINSGVHNGFSAEFVGHRRIMRYGVAAGVLDLLDDVFGGFRRRPTTVDADSVVGDDHACALGGQQQRVTAADAATGAGDDDYAAVEPQFGHRPAGASNRICSDVGERKA